MYSSIFEATFYHMSHTTVTLETASSGIPKETPSNLDALLLEDTIATTELVMPSNSLTDGLTIRQRKGSLDSRASKRFPAALPDHRCAIRLP